MKDTDISQSSLSLSLCLFLCISTTFLAPSLLWSPLGQNFLLDKLPHPTPCPFTPESRKVSVAGDSSQLGRGLGSPTDLLIPWDQQ